MGLDDIIKSSKKTKRKEFISVGITMDNYYKLRKVCKDNNLALRPFVNNILSSYLEEIEQKEEEKQEK